MENFNRHLKFPLVKCTLCVIFFLRFCEIFVVFFVVLCCLFSTILRLEGEEMCGILTNRKSKKVLLGRSTVFFGLWWGMS